MAGYQDRFPRVVDRVKDFTFEKTKDFEIVQVGDMNYHTEEIKKIVAAKPGSAILTLTKGGKIGIWDENVFHQPPMSMKTWKCCGEIQETQGKPLDVILSPGGSYAFIALDEGSLSKWNIRGKVKIWDFHAHDTAINVVTMSSECGYVATGSAGGQLNIYNMDNKIELVNSFKDCQKSSIVALGFHPLKNFHLYSCGEKKVKRWNIRKGFDFDLNHGIKNGPGIMAMNISKKIEYLAYGGMQNKGSVYDISEPDEKINTCKRLCVFNGLTNDDIIKSLSFSPDGILLAGATGKNVTIWHAISCCAPVIKIVNRTPDVTSTAVEWSFNGDYLYVGYSNGSISVFSTLCLADAIFRLKK